MHTHAATLSRTQGISFPRSGHGALYHLLRLYFDGALIYCDPEVPRGHVDDTGSLCGCGRVPCENPDNNLAKNHDFGLLLGERSLPVHADWRYLIQYRNPVRAIVSDFFLHLRTDPQDDHLPRWRSFAFEKLAYWNRFMDKWVLHRTATRSAGSDDAAPAFFDLPYEQLVGTPQTASHRVVAWLSPQPVDEHRLQRALERVKLRPLDRFQAFHHADPGFFAELEARTGQRMAQANVPGWRDSL